MRKSFKRFIVSSFALFPILFAVSEASAQNRKVIIYKPYKPAPVIYRPAQYPYYVSPGYSKTQVDSIINRVEENVDDFVGLFDRSLDNSNLDGTRREDYLNRRSKDLERATDELRREFDRRDSWAENRSEVARCLNIATDINSTMRNRRLSRSAEYKWSKVRSELNALAAAYRLPKIGSWAY